MTEQRLGKYRLDRRLGAGGMAEVFLATVEGPEGFTKRVAIKRVLPHLTENKNFVAMFLDEAKLAARFAHPNIVQIYELGISDDQYFVVMEYVAGAMMARLCAECQALGRTLPPTHVAKIIAAACDGLDYAHEFVDVDGTPLGIVHRDVSPHNLMLSYDGVLKLLDFGIAKAASNLHRTMSTTLKGKLAYMSPEQAQQNVTLDRRSDIFSLGVTLFELLSGVRPYRGKNELELLNAIVYGEPPDLHSVSPDIPDELADIVHRAMRKDREERYATAREMRADLEKFMAAHRPVDAPALGALLREIIPAKEAFSDTLPGELAGDGTTVQLERSPSRPRRTGRAVMVAAAALGATSGVLGWREWQARKTPPTPKTTASVASAAAPPPAVQAAPAVEATQTDTTNAPSRRSSRPAPARPRPPERGNAKLRQGELWVFVQPFGEVFVDGESKGLTPLDGPLSLAEGTHTLRVVGRTRSKSERITIEAGKTQRLNIDLR
jgi:eukaryotic-like serine/threonine-protein kinase